jgi:hypothetical protein
MTQNNNFKIKSVNFFRDLTSVEFKIELHKKLYIKSGAKDYNDYIKYINSISSDNKKFHEKINSLYLQ